MIPSWKRSEFDGADKHGGRRHSFSGIKGGDPGDFTAGLFRFDNKAPDRQTKSYSFSAATWEKINHEARFDGYLPAMRICLQDTAPLIVCEEEDFIALNQELDQYRNSEMKYAAKAPKISKANRAALRIPNSESNYFQPIRDSWLKRQAEGVKAHKWSGNISPSAKLSFSMCIEDFFKRVHEPLEFVPDTLMAVNMGTLIHKGFESEVLKVPDLLYPFAEYPNDPELAAWAEKIKPEVPVWCRSSGVKGKIDAVLNVDGRPFVFDLKTKNMNEKSWKKFCENDQIEIAHITQICVYINRLNASGIYPVKITHGSLGYLNMPSKPFARGSFIEKPVSYEKYRKKTNILLRALSKGRRQELAGKKVVCKNELCPTHGKIRYD